MPKDAAPNGDAPVEDDLIDLSVGPRRRVSEMQAKLHRWAAADPGRRFDDLSPTPGPRPPDPTHGRNHGESVEASLVRTTEGKLWVVNPRASLRWSGRHIARIK